MQWHAIVLCTTGYEKHIMKSEVVEEKEKT